MTIEAQAAGFREKYERLKQEVGKVIVGHEDIIEQVIVTLLAGGNALLEGVPGLGKTLLVKTMAECLRLEFSRIQFTPDLMPADIVGTNIVMEDDHGRRRFEFQPGPIFGNIILTDEINRATPKTQSALLEAMQERSVTVAGTTRKMTEPFFVLATQNPIEMEGTYPLPEAQLDRFLFKLHVQPSRLDDLVEVLKRTTGKETPTVQPVLSGEQIIEMRQLAREVPVASHVLAYAGRIALGSHPNSEVSCDAAKRYIRYGSSPRGAQAMILAGKIFALAAGRYNVAFADIRKAAPPALRHRIILNFEGEAEGIHPDDIVAQLIEQVPEAPAEVEKVITG